MDQHVLLSQPERLDYMLQLSKIVKETSEHVLGIAREKIFDTVEVARHQFSTVSAEASNNLRANLEKHLKNFPGSVVEESDIPRVLLELKQLKPLLLLCDAVEGETNAKRGLASGIHRPIQAGTMAMILESQELCMIAASAFCDFASKQVFASVRTESGCFLSFVDGRILAPNCGLETQGDSHRYAIVPGYSHANVEARALVDRSLMNIGIEILGGSRSSAQDLINLLTNQADAYVDLRALFPGSTESRDEALHTWDVGGLLPILECVGFRITDVLGQSWQRLRIWDRLAIVVTRPALQSKILEALRLLPFVASMCEPEKQNIILYPTPAL